MAIEVFPDSPSVGISPRISFSHDLPQTDTVPVEQYVRSSSSSSSAIDFDFCVFRESFEYQQPSSADELFSDGKILPIEIKRRLPPSKKPSPPPPPAPAPVLLPPPPPPEIQEEKQQKSSFWGFKRSTSLNCGNGYARTLCPLPLLSRSNSTGSTTSSSVKRSGGGQKMNLPKCPAPNGSSKAAAGHQKPPLKKGGHHGSGGVKIVNPVLHVMPPANLFGLGSLFSGGREMRSKKKY